jgi:hypothetical protein
VDRAGAAQQLNGLSGVWEQNARGDGDDLDRADLAAPVPGLGDTMLRPECAPGQLGELSAQARLVALDRERPVRAALVQVGDVTALGV